MMNQDTLTVVTTLALYLAVVVSPGPSFALVSRMAVAGERRGAFGAALGLAAGATVYAVLTMTGLAVVLAQIGWLARALQVAGGVYLIYLGVRTWLDAGAPPPAAAGSVDASSFATGARRGFVMCLSNPKAIAFFVGLYAAAIPPGTALWAKGVILAGAFAIEVGWYGAVALVLSGRHVRSLYERGRKPFERMMGAVLAAFGVRMLGGNPREAPLRDCRCVYRPHARRQSCCRDAGRSRAVGRTNAGCHHRVRSLRNHLKAAPARVVAPSGHLTVCTRLHVKRCVREVGAKTGESA